MKRFKIKVTELTSGNSFIVVKRSYAAAKDYCDYVNRYIKSDDGSFVVKAEIVK